VSNLTPHPLFISKVLIEVHQHNTEDKNKILEGLAYLLPESYHGTLDQILEISILHGYHKNEIKRYSCQFNKKKQAKEVTTFVLKKVSNSLTDSMIIDRLNSHFELYINK
jgi:RNA binding exosome subunit